MRGTSAGHFPQGSGYRDAWLVWEKLPLFALVAASAMITFIAQSHGALCVHSPCSYCSPTAYAVVSYAKLLTAHVLANDLAVYYPLRHIGLADHRAAFLLMELRFFVSQRRIRVPRGWLALVSGNTASVIDCSGWRQTMADRYFYIPSIGLFIALVFGLADIAKSWRVAPALGAGIAGAILLILATLSNAKFSAGVTASLCLSTRSRSLT